MNRLLQGDVGSGKTVVAAFSALQAVEDKYQVAIMAPTEILAGQHFRNLSTYFENLPLRVGILTSGLSRKERDIVYEAAELGEINVLVGTHALIQDPLAFKRLGLVVMPLTTPSLAPFLISSILAVSRKISILLLFS